MRYFVGLIFAIGVVLVLMVVGLILISNISKIGIFDNSTASTTFNNTISTLQSSGPLLGLVVLGLIGAAIVSGITIYTYGPSDSTTQEVTYDHDDLEESPETTEELVKNSWTCTYCNAHNERNPEQCFNCGAPRKEQNKEAKQQ